MFIKELEKHGKLLRNFTQNIDTIELTAGIENVIQCHGSFASATCMRCKAAYSCEDVRADIFAQVVPRCKKCAHLDNTSESTPLQQYQQQLSPEQLQHQQQQHQQQQPQQKSSQEQQHHPQQEPPSSSADEIPTDQKLTNAPSPSPTPVDAVLS